IFLNKKIEALSKSASVRPHCYRSLSDIKNVLIVCEAKNWNSVNLCIETLKSMGKTVNICVYTKKGDDTPIWDYASLLVEAERNINLWGFPDSNIRNQMNSLSVDMLLDLTSGDIPVMRYLMLQHPASFKVGAKRSPEENFYDFSIVMKEGIYDISFLFAQILNYLQVIRSK
ncbi:MAG: hypothetical protein LBE79_11500, partial [Tannerella sp.]|nr:hypothetical protein [Tannerella sp.]